MRLSSKHWKTSWARILLVFHSLPAGMCFKEYPLPPRGFEELLTFIDRFALLPESSFFLLSFLYLLKSFQIMLHGVSSRSPKTTRPTAGSFRGTTSLYINGYESGPFQVTGQLHSNHFRCFYFSHFTQ